MGVKIEMPEVSEEVEINITIHKVALERILQLKPNEVMKFCDGCHHVTITRNGDEFVFSLSENVTIEFELSDYAPERDESHD